MCTQHEAALGANMHILVGQGGTLGVEAQFSKVNGLWCFQQVTAQLKKMNDFIFTICNYLP